MWECLRDGRAGVVISHGKKREREMETDRLPTFVEVVSRRTRPPVDLFMF